MNKTEDGEMNMYLMCPRCEHGIPFDGFSPVGNCPHCGLNHGEQDIRDILRFCKNKKAIRGRGDRIILDEAACVDPKLLEGREGE